MTCPHSGGKFTRVLWPQELLHCCCFHMGTVLPGQEIGCFSMSVCVTVTAAGSSAQLSSLVKTIVLLLDTAHSFFFTFNIFGIILNLPPLSDSEW